MRILVAEDSPAMGHYLCDLLQESGHEPVLAKDGIQALWLLEDRRCDVVLTDWEMPRLSGLALCRRIRELPQPEYTYLIVQTVRANREDLLQALEAGADDFLTKPVDAEILIARLKVAERVLKLQGEVQRLKNLIPICAYCKRIRDDQNFWTEVETYLGETTGNRFTHGICPDCHGKFLGQNDASS